MTSTTDTARQLRASLIIQILIALAVLAAFGAAGDWATGAVGCALVLALVAFLWFFRGRSETVELMTGIGDERTRRLYACSATITAGVFSFLLPAAFLVSAAIGEPNQTLAALGAVYALVWLGSIAWVRLRTSRRGGPA